MTTQLVDQPGINLDWLNVDTERGMEIEQGRKGLTLEAINQMSYGVEDRDQARARQWVPRGSQPDPRTPSNSVQHLNKADVWSDSAMLLYEEALQRQWSSARDIPWETIDADMPEDLERAMCTLCTFLTQVEFIAGGRAGAVHGAGASGVLRVAAVPGDAADGRGAALGRVPQAGRWSTGAGSRGPGWGRCSCWGRTISRR